MNYDRWNGKESTTWHGKRGEMALKKLSAYYNTYRYMSYDLFARPLHVVLEARL
jgi:hypothetical protein